MDKVMHELVNNRVQKLELLDRMLDLTQRERMQLVEDAVEELVQTTEEWHAAAKEVEDLDDTYRNVVKFLMLQDTKEPLGNFAQELNDYENKAGELLREIQQVQMECNAMAERKMEQYKSELKDIRKSNQRASSYASAYGVVGDGIYFDQKK